MDTSKLSQGQMIAGVGGVILVIALFLNWDDLASQNAFDLFSGIDIVLLVIGAAAIAYAGLTMGGSAASLPPYSAWLLSVLGILAVGIALSIDLEDESAGIGAWLGLIGAGAIAYGAHAARTQVPVGASPRAAAPPPPPATGTDPGSAGPPGAV